MGTRRGSSIHSRLYPLISDLLKASSYWPRVGTVVEEGWGGRERVGVKRGQQLMMNMLCDRSPFCTSHLMRGWEGKNIIPV